MSYSVLYIPGVGDRENGGLQRRYIGLLNLFRRRKIVYFEALWGSGESYADKFARLLKVYEESGSPSIIYGISAGASLAVCLGSKYRSTRLPLVAGKVQGADSVGPRYFKRYVALIESVRASEQAVNDLRGSKVTCYQPKSDDVVPLADMVVPGARVVRLPVNGHIAAIVYANFRHLPFIR